MGYLCVTNKDGVFRVVVAMSAWDTWGFVCGSCGIGIGKHKWGSHSGEYTIGL